jgi:hypothetical protein
MSSDISMAKKRIGCIGSLMEYVALRNPTTAPLTVSFHLLRYTICISASRSPMRVFECSHHTFNFHQCVQVAPPPICCKIHSQAIT